MQLPKTYSHKDIETKWYNHWMSRGLFAPADRPGPSFSMVIPPPNVTGSLHMGHALNNTLQDILCRYKRMDGYRVLWVPGTDHAGIATQNVVERQLAKKKISRTALGRKKFVETVWNWKREAGDAILHQLKALGVSCDWSHERFTMDAGLSHAVREAFVQLWEDRLLYRAQRLINWCPRCKTALGDIEVVHGDADGTLWHVRYPLADNPAQHLVVATTRPETMLGDTAVAVHPEDERYQSWIGKKIRLPITGRIVPVIADAYVDRAFGSGALKITPGHDFNDFEIGERFGLDKISIFDADARIDANAFLARGETGDWVARYGGKDRFEARKLIVGELEREGFLEKAEPHKLSVGHCYRCQTIIEPYLTPQWFVDIKPLAKPAITVVQEGNIRIIPEGWSNSYFAWMENIKDWCVSRQIWWGHQIPAWYCVSCDRANLIEGADGEYRLGKAAKPIVAREVPSHCPICRGRELIQDPDVLDTWFSSGLWPFSTLGWPEQTEDLKTFYPTSALVTGFDILFFWVARMIMMGLKFMGDVPFHDVYIHALVRDAEGQKMSKSKGNVIDPLSVMDTYGTDALRFTLASMASPGRDIKLAEERIEGYRNFANKIWNATRFSLMNLDGPRMAVAPTERTFPDRWILSRLNQTIKFVTSELEAYRFDRAASALYRFIWHEYCDWYLELIKPTLQNSMSPEGPGTRQTLVETLETTMRLLHPFMPFLTEEIWHTLPHQGESIVIQRYPISDATWAAPEMDQRFTLLEQTIGLVRTSRVLLNYPPGQQLTFYVAHDEPRQQSHLDQLRSYLAHLGRGTVELTSTAHWPTSNLLRLVTEGLSVGIAVAGDVDLNKALDRIIKEQSEQTKEIER